ncbi:MAG: hypothetical protein ACUVT1_10990, partial [Anaerolineae bacterium]
MSSKSIVWTLRLLFSLVAALTFILFNTPTRYMGMAAPPDNDHIVTPQEARTVAENWLRFVVERDGQWGGVTNPSIRDFAEFKRGDRLLGYYASIEPQGYIVITSLEDFAPIQAYSTTSDLDPDNEVGMCDLLKDVMDTRLAFLVEAFGGL